MSFFGSVFAALTMYWQWGFTGIALMVPFLVFAVIGLAAGLLIRATGRGSDLSEGAQRVVMWSSIAEGVGLFLAGNIVVNLHRPALLLPAMAMIVGLHFLPIARAALFRPFYILGTALILSAVAGFALGGTTGGTVAGLTSAIALWIAAALAVRRGWGAKGGAAQSV